MSKTAVTILRLRERATLDWLVSTFGFTVSEVTPPEGDELHHAQLTYGTSVLMASATGGRLDQAPGYASVYLTLETDAEVDAVFAKAIAAGAASVLPPEDMPYGGRNATVRDPDGNTWSVGSYQPSV
ncbi:MAG: VOC family protein [Solirubrobacteraceae bacterium]|nr:VOC family protein [Solirubrobacteraceae bacterium]